MIAIPCLMPLFHRIGEDYLVVGSVAGLSLVLLSACIAMACRKQNAGSFSWVDILLAGYLLYVFVNGAVHGFTQSSMIGWKWAAAMLVFLLGKRISDDRSAVPMVLGSTALVQATVVLLQQVGVLQSLSFYFPVSGTFGNPQYPAAIICTGLASLLDEGRRHFREYGKLQRVLLFATVLFLSAALVCCGARSCFLALLVVASVLVYRARPGKRVAVMLSIVVVAGLVALYFIRPGSANVRLLIWRAGFPLFLEKPVFGGGPGAFAKGYMYAQAAFFASHPESPLAIFANNHFQPYNELLRLLCEQGLFGTGLFILALIHLVKGCDRTMVPIVCICAIGLTFNVSDLFILYLQFWFLAGISAAGQPAVQHVGMRFALPFMTVLSAAFMCVATSKMLSPEDRTAQRNRVACVSYERICEEGEQFWQAGDQDAARQRFELAWQMIPCRITAPYLLFRSYRQDDVKKACEMVEYILDKQQVQYVSGRVLEIRAEIRAWYELNIKP